ncbi:MAG: hypothetical protein P8125_10030 [Gemmatimonadota bacterium]
MTQDKSRLAFLFAEAVLIVLSILLAFAIDAAWDGRQEAVQRIELLGALHADFAATSEDLDRAIEHGEAVVARTGGYLRAARLRSDMSHDSLAFLFSGVGDIAFFEATVASYRTALSTGSIELARSATLIAALTEFNFAERLYRLHLDVSADLYYLGPLQDLRRAGVVFDDPELREARMSVSVPTSFDLFSTLAISSAEPLYTVQVNMLRNLRDMRAAAGRVTTALDSLLAR